MNTKVHSIVPGRSLRSCRHLMTIAAAMLVLAACESNDGSLANTAPTISGLTDQTIAQDSVGAPIDFTVADNETDASALAVRVESSNSALFPADGLVLSGSGGSRTLTLIPTERASGSARITVVASDEKGAATRATFAVQVTTMQVSFKAFTGSTFAIDENAMPQSLAGISFTQDADDPTAFDALLN